MIKSRESGKAAVTDSLLNLEIIRLVCFIMLKGSLLMRNLTCGVLVRQDNGQRFRIRDEVIVIGRNYDCDIQIEMPYVSRVHAVICRENGTLVLEDLGGRNGTRVNRVAVSRKVLSDGDRIHIGRAELVFKT